MEAIETNPITELGNELLNNLNCLIREINLTVLGIESRQANDIKDKILLRQQHVYQVIQVLGQLQISLNLTNEDQETLDSFIAIFHTLTHPYYTSGLGTDCTNSTTCVLTEQYCNTPGRPKFDIPKEVLKELRVLGFSWVNTSKMFKVSRWAIAQRVSDYNFDSLRRHSNMTNNAI